MKDSYSEDTTPIFNGTKKMKGTVTDFSIVKIEQDPTTAGTKIPIKQTKKIVAAPIHLAE